MPPPDTSRVLVLVKATPQPSRQYGDTVCVAGLDLTSNRPRWLRLYPVPFRYMDGDRQFRKYDVIRVRTRDAGSDRRPESRKIDADSLTIDSHIDRWPDRTKWVEPLAGPSMCDLVAAASADVNATSLAAVRPAAVDGLSFREHPGWSAEELARFEVYRRQGDLFREVSPSLLSAPALIVHLRYRCAAPGCTGHVQRIIDWELTALQHRYRQRPDDLRAAIARNFLKIPFATDRAPMIFVGNQADIRRRASYTVLGLYYPRRSEVAQTETLFQ